MSLLSGGWESYLWDGTGLPWAGHVKLSGSLSPRRILVRSVSEENFGPLPEIGSDKTGKLRGEFYLELGRGQP